MGQFAHMSVHIVRALTAPHCLSANVLKQRIFIAIESFDERKKGKTTKCSSTFAIANALN